jgi:hypothetical protein
MRRIAVSVKPSVVGTKSPTMPFLVFTEVLGIFDE